MTTTNLDQAFYPALRQLAHDVGVPPSWFLLIFYLESTLNPASHTPNTRYYGLNQMDRDELARRNVVPEEYLTWPASVQMNGVITPWYVSTVRSYGRGKVPASPGVLYAYNLAPGNVYTRGQTEDTVLYAKAGPTAFETSAYNQNAGLDVDHSNTITIRDLDTILLRKAREAPFRIALAELGVEESLSPSSRIASAGRSDSQNGMLNPVAPKALAVVGLVGLAAAWWMGQEERR
jgi:hypothetical protein